jgi:hypothetical protein
MTWLVNAKAVKRLPSWHGSWIPPEFLRMTGVSDRSGTDVARPDGLASSRRIETDANGQRGGGHSSSDRRVPLIRQGA